MPTMPSKPGKLRTVLGGFVAVIMLAATPVVVEPSLIDPLCDDYVWDGAEAAAIVRGYAREANVAIDLGEVLNAPLEKLDASSVP